MLREALGGSRRLSGGDSRVRNDRIFSPAAQREKSRLATLASHIVEVLILAGRTRRFLKQNRKKSRLAALAKPSSDNHMH